MELVNIIYNGSGVTPQDLNPRDKNLVVSNFINANFGDSQDYIELFIYGETGNLLEADYDASDYYPYIQNNPQNNTYSSLTLDPEKDVKNRGYNRGKLNIQYNFYRRLFNSQFGTFYWIKEISNSRTELKLASQVLSDSLINEGFNQYRAYISSKNYYPIFYLNFGNNITVVANNVAYTEDDQGSYLLIKLYEPLPNDFDIKSELWIIDKIATSVSFNVTIEVESEETDNRLKLRGPNYNVELNNKNAQTTPYYTYDYLVNNAITSSFQKLSSYYQDKAVDINVDYSNFKNFIHFSSAVQRVNNFVYKLNLIEEAKSSIASQQSIVSGPSTILSQSISVEQKIIDNIIKNFDTYEYFLYFQSSSWAWPKSTSTQPYQLYSTTSSQAQNFLGTTNTVPTATTQSLLWSASYYDSTNKDLFHNSIPQYLLDDPANQPYITFLDMIGQHFDNIWIYYKDVTNRYYSANNPNIGVSMDIVGEALKALGLKLYTNTNVSNNLYYSLFGINPDGSLLPPTGSELITKYVTSSLTTLPANTIQQEIYKRLYHNVPYLYKTKGSLQSIKALISIYGIPDSILSVREFGGNYTGSLDGILDLNSSDYKVIIVSGSGVTGSATISSSLLSPYTTIQYYQGNRRLNSSNLEIGFSPSNIINENIANNVGIFNLDQLIGSPGFQYSSSYTPLVSASNAYFSSYVQKNSIWEYIRLLKFYDNSLFKLIKDFVPARANVSTGIIIKSHLFERNKYARHEPNFTFNDYSQSIEMVEISADNGGALSGSTNWSNFIVTPLGLASYSSSQNQELYNGQLDGTLIIATDGLAMEQSDYVNHTTGSINFYNYGALYQNITSSVRSQNLIDLDYNSNQLKPVNYGIVTYSLDELNINAYNAYTNFNNPFAQVQDYNYNLNRSIIPRYYGSFTISAKYNTYTPGDSSYGKTAAIDKIKTQYAYIVDIYSSSFQMPYRAKGQIKYLIDNDENVLNLSKNNTNWFSVQNIFKAGEYADVSLFDYDPTNPYINKLNNSDNDFTIWESGYSYTPLIYNPSGSLTYTLQTPEIVTTGGGSPTYTQIFAGNVDYWSSWTAKFSSPYTGVGLLNLTSSAVGSPGDSPSNNQVIVTYYVTNTSGRFGIISTYPQSGYATVTIPSNTAEPFKTAVYLGSQYAIGSSAWLSTDSLSVTIVKEEIFSGGSPATTTYVTSSKELDATWRVTNLQNQIILSLSQSVYYGDFISTGTYEGLEAFVFPFNVNSNDMIRLYNYSSSMWTQDGEFRVLSIGSVASGSNIGGSTTIDYNAIALNLDRIVPKEYTAVGSDYPLTIEKYLLLKRLNDETSIYFNYNLPQTIPQDGTLFPQYIGPGIKENSGNVIKSLKQQNLI